MERTEYIESWNNHVSDFGRLAFCSNEKLSKEVRDCMEKLRELIPKIAEIKELK